MSFSKSTLIRAGVVVVGLSTLVPTGDVDAQRRRGGQQGQAAQQQRARVRMSEAIRPSLNGLQWGWTRQRTLRFLREALEAEYEPIIRESTSGESQFG